MFKIDAHLDLSMNAFEWNRDLRKSVFEIRERENGLTDKADRAKATVGQICTGTPYSTSPTL